MAPEARISWSGVLCVFLMPALGGLLYGYDIGATSFVLDMLTRDEPLTELWWKDFAIRYTQKGLTVAALSLGALGGSHIVLFYLANRIGRRMELRIASILYLAGSLLNMASGRVFSTYNTLGWLSLVFGRIIFGMGVGFVMHASATYMAEMAPSQIRGAMVSAKETVIVLGIVFGYLVGDLISSQTDDWTRLYFVSFVASGPMLLLTFFVPRSMRWLLLNGHRAEAYESMKFVYSGDINFEFNKLAATLEGNKDQQPPSIPGFTGLCKSRLFLSPELRPALKASLGLIIFQQFSGQPSLLSYATILFNAAGWSGHASVVTAALMFGVSCLTVALVDRVGRRRLLLACISILLVSALTLSHFLWNRDTEQLSALSKTFILVTMFVYIGGYQVGFGPITWCFVSEVFPNDVRGTATAIFVELNYLLNFLVQFAVPVIRATFGWGSTFLFFGSFLASGLYFVYHFVPETAGLSLEEIEDIFRKSDATTSLSLDSSEGSPLTLSERKSYDSQSQVLIV